jgi:hypothetical protein
MATAEQLRCLALTRAGAIEAPHADRTAFRVARSFATLAPDGAIIKFGSAPDKPALKRQIQPPICVPLPNISGARSWTIVGGDASASSELRGAPKFAWRHALPRTRRTKQREKTG